MAFGFGMSLPVAISTALGNQNRYAAIINDAGELAPYVTFTRSSTATRFNSAGLLETVAANAPRYDYDPTTVTRANLLRYSQEFDNAVWSVASAAGLTVSANATTAPDGTTTADKLVETATTDFHARRQAVAGVGSIRRFSIRAKAAERSKLRFWSFSGGDTSQQDFDLAAGTCAGTLSPSIQPLGDGWYLCSCNIPAPNGVISLGPNDGTIGTDNYAGTAGAGIFVWGAQVEYGSVTTDYIPTTASPAGNATLRGLLIEEQRTNLLVRSEDLTAAAWSAVELGAITANATVAPDGALTADKITETVNNSGHYIAQAATTTAAVHTLTIYAKASERSFVGLFHVESSTGMSFNLSSGTVGSLIIGAPVSQKITSVGNGWQRCEISVNATAGNNNFRIFIMTDATTFGYVGTVGSGIFLWGAQLEAGAFATSYIPTTTAAVTRAADGAAVNALSSIGYQASGGTLFADYTRAAAINMDIVFIHNGVPESIGMYMSSGNTLVGWCRAGGVNQALADPATVSTGRCNASFAFANSSFAASLNGGAVTERTAGSLATPNRLTFGNPANGIGIVGQMYSGHIRRLRYYNRRLSNAQLQALTAP